VAYSTQWAAIYADTQRSDHEYGLYTPDYISAGRYVTTSADVAEYMPVSGDASPGTVLVIGDDRQLRPSDSAYDHRVAGIVSADPGVSLGTREDGNDGEALVAVAGRVPCKVDASVNPIHAGDLLATSDRPGYAMKAIPVTVGDAEIFRPGTVIGKAFESLANGTGTIEIIVSLQ
jgi:hypothetical protein